MPRGTEAHDRQQPLRHGPHSCIPLRVPTAVVQGEDSMPSVQPGLLKGDAIDDSRI